MSAPLILIPWIGYREPDPAVLGALQEVDPRADLRWVPGSVGRPPVWELGSWGDFDKERRAGAVHMLDAQYARPVSLRKPGQMMFAYHVLEGWRPLFQISGREPDGRDVREFQFRDWILREAFEQEMEKFFAEETEDEKRERNTKKAEAMASDETLMGLLQRGRVSTHGAGLSVL